MALTLVSSAFSEGGSIPTLYTCEGPNISPELSWSGAPPQTQCFVLIMDDPDAPDPAAPKMTWVHWVLYNLPASCSALAKDIAPDKLPPGTHSGRNSWGRVGYGGPCPPIGRHRYYHKLYALSTMLPDMGQATKDQVLAAMQGHILEQAQLMGTYAKVGQK